MNILDSIQRRPKIDPNLVRKINKSPELQIELLNRTHFLKSDSSVSCRLWSLKNKIDSQPQCKNCQKDITFKNGGFSQFCCVQCVHDFEKNNPDIKNKRHQNQKKTLNIIGADGLTGYQRGIHTIWKNIKNEENSDEKIKQMRIKTRETKISNGTLTDERLRASKTRKEKTIFQLLDKFEILNEDEFLNNFHKSLIVICKTCNSKHEFSTGRIDVNFICETCFPHTRSSIERTIAEILSKHNIDVVVNKKRMLDSKNQIDFYSEEFKIGIEVNGDYYHSEKFIDERYHINKLSLCYEKGIKLIQFFENEIKNKKDICESIILNKFNKITEKIDARKCQVCQISSKDAKEFFNSTHIQGFTPAKYYFALKYNDEIISCMSFRKPRFNSKFDFEIIRFSNKLRTVVRGGLSKLISNFKKEFTDSSIITYADLRFGDGKSYEKAGAKFIHSSNPNYWYIVNNKMLSRYECQKHKLEKLLGSRFNPTLSEKDNMKNFGALKTWDCGNNVFIF